MWLSLIDGSPSETTPPVTLIFFIGLLIYTMIKVRLLVLIRTCFTDDQIANYMPPKLIEMAISILLLIDVVDQSASCDT